MHDVRERVEGMATKAMDGASQVVTANRPALDALAAGPPSPPRARLEPHNGSVPVRVGAPAPFF
jgi:hypothetical protein